MRILFLVALLCLPLFVFGYVSVVSIPSDEFDVFTITEPTKSQEFFGVLTNFPHTYSFSLSEETDFVATLFARDSEEQKNDTSMIIIKEEKRGVSEVGRTDVKSQSWEVTSDTQLSESFRFGGVLEARLAPGVYRLEVSSPSNDASYRLVLHDEKIERSYFDSVRMLFEVKKLYGSSLISSVLSPLIYVPLSVVMLLVFGTLTFWRLRFKKE